MENDTAWYTWAAEPTESDDGKPVLRFYDGPDCRQLDKRALKETIERVDLWYDALFPTLIANGPRGSKPDRTRAKQ